MSSLMIEGGSPICGEMKIQGSKNAALPILAASILVKGITKITNCPRISDVACMLEILKSLGCIIQWEENLLLVDASTVSRVKIPGSEARMMRSSLTLLGALLGRRGEACIPYPGGCSIGRRPIDIHLTALREMNIEIDEREKELYARAGQMKNTEVVFSYPSVGATQNAVLSCVLSGADITLQNSAREPEVEELCNFLNMAGAKITGVGTKTLRISGVKALKEIEYEIKGDRIAAGTYLAAAAATGGELLIKGIQPFTLSATLHAFARTGCIVKQYHDAVALSTPAKECLKPVSYLRTEPYPGFPTDMQSQFMSIFALSDGISIIKETVFEGRFKTAEELQRMGADIRIQKEENIAVIKGRQCLKGAEMYAHDLRGGAALVIAALAAEGRSVIHDFFYVERGYEQMSETLNALGGCVKLQP